MSSLVLDAPSGPVRRRSEMRAVSRLPLPEALEACLELLDSEPARYERAALVWHARLVAFAPDLTLSEARAGLNALAALQTPDAGRAAFRLARLCGRSGLQGVASVLEQWRHGHPHVDGWS